MNERTRPTFGFRLSHWLALAQVLLGFSVVIAYSGVKSYWLDEAVAIRIVRDWTTLITELSGNEGAKHWLYHLPIYLMLKLGDSEFWLRSYSVFFAAATVPIVIVLGRAIGGNKVGHAAGLIFSINHNLVAHAQEARMYTMLIFFTAAAMYFFVRANRDPRLINWLGFIATGTLAIFTHVFGVLSILSLAGMAIFKMLRPRAMLQIGASTMIIFVLAGTVTSLLGSSGMGGPLTTDWIPLPTARTILGLAHFVSGQTLPWWFHIVVMMITAACALGLIKNRKIDRWGIGVALFCLILPIAGVVAASYVIVPMFLNRYLVMCMAPYSLIVGIAFSQLRNDILVAAAAIAFVISPARNVFGEYHKPREDWRSAVTFLQLTTTADDGVVFLPSYMAVPYGVYQQRYATRGLWQNAPVELDGNAFAQSDAHVTRHPRVWLVQTKYPSDTDPASIMSVLTANYESQPPRDFEGVEVTLFSRKP